MSDAQSKLDAPTNGALIGSSPDRPVIGDTKLAVSVDGQPSKARMSQPVALANKPHVVVTGASSDLYLRLLFVFSAEAQP